jgi:hypothetical protein
MGSVRMSANFRIDLDDRSKMIELIPHMWVNEVAINRQEISGTGQEHYHSQSGTCDPGKRGGD